MWHGNASGASAPGWPLKFPEFENPRWRTAAILKYRTIIISPQPFDWFWWNLARRCIWDPTDNQLLKFPKSKMADGCHLKKLKNHQWPILMKLAWLCIWALCTSLGVKNLRLLKSNMAVVFVNTLNCCGALFKGIKWLLHRPAAYLSNSYKYLIDIGKSSLLKILIKHEKIIKKLITIYIMLYKLKCWNSKT